MFFMLWIGTGLSLLLVSLGLEKRIHARIAAATGISILGLFVALIVLSFTSGPDPHVSMAELGGLTPDQVISRLGPPAHRDPRKPVPGHPEIPLWTPEKEAENDPLLFEYYDPVGSAPSFVYALLHPHVGHVYGIEFKDGVVAKVAIGSK